jgi:hypothetical protein
MYKNELYVSIKITFFAGHFPALESLAHQSSSLIPSSRLLISFVYLPTVVLIRGTVDTDSWLTPPLHGRLLFCHALSTVTPLSMYTYLSFNVKALTNLFFLFKIETVKSLCFLCGYLFHQVPVQSLVRILLCYPM